MITNITESFNNVLKGVRGLPLCSIIELTFYRTTDYFRDRGNAAMQCSTRFSPRVESIRHGSIVQGFLTWATTSLRLCAVVGTHQDTLPETPSNNASLEPTRSGAHATSQNCTIFHALMFLRLAKIWGVTMRPITFLRTSL